VFPVVAELRVMNVRLRNNNNNVLVHSRPRYDADFEVGGLRGPREGTVSTSLDPVISGATVLPPTGSSKTSNLMEDFETRGKISLLFFASYFIGWIVIAMMFWSSDFEQLVVVNLIMAITAVVAFFAQKPRTRSLLHGSIIVITV